MSEEEETKANEESRSEERAYSESKEYEQEADQAQANQEQEKKARTESTEAFNRAIKARDAKLALQGEILGGIKNSNTFSPETARRTFNLLSTSEIDPPSELIIYVNDDTSKNIDLKNLPKNLESQIKQILGVQDKNVAKIIANTLQNLSNPSERLQYLSETNRDFQINGKYSEYDSVQGVGYETTVDSEARFAREVLKNSRSLIEGKIRKFGNVSEIEINGAKYKVEGTAILKDGEIFLRFDTLQDTINNLSAATERLEQLERGGGSAADIETQRGKVAEGRSAVAKFFGDLTAKDVYAIIALVFTIREIIALENLLKAWINQKQKEISGCYLISSDTYLHDPKNTSCTSCASSTFKVSSCGDADCCTPFQAKDNPLPNGFTNKYTYWNIGTKDNVTCKGNLTHPSYLSIEKCFEQKQGQNTNAEKPQLSADAVAEFLKHEINVPSSPLPLALWTPEGSVTYAIRRISSSDALVEVACDTEKTLCNLGSGVGNLILKIALPILIVCVLFYFVKFEYDKHDGKIKAKYRK